jgi:outer membrane protein
MKKLIKLVLVAVTLLISFNASADLKIGYVELNQIMQSQPALDIGKKLQSEFSTRISQIEQAKKKISDKQSALDKDAKNLSDADLKTKSKEISDLSIEFERKQRELNEDASLRKNEEMKKFQDQINKVIDSIAQTEGYDLILYNGAAFTSKKINITDKVIAAVGK